MTRLWLLLAVVGAFVVVAGILLMWDWQTLPPSRAQTLDTSRFARDDDVALVRQWDTSVTLARRALTSRDVAVLPADQGGAAGGDPQLGRFANVFRETFEVERQIRQFYRCLEDTNFHTVKQLFLALKQQDRLAETLSASNVPERLRTHQDAAVRDAAIAALNGLRRPFDEFLVRRAAIEVVEPAAMEAFEANRYEQCVALCTCGLAHIDVLGAERRNEVQPKLELCQGRSQEILDWRLCTDLAVPDVQAITRLRTYIDKYGPGRPAAQYGLHVPEARTLLAWKELLGTLPAPVVDVVHYYERGTQQTPLNDPDLEKKTGRLNELELDTPIRGLCGFCRSYKDDLRHIPIARSAATVLLTAWFQKDPILKPNPELVRSEKMKVTVRLTGAEFVGLVDRRSTDDHIVTIADPDNGEVKRYFRNALAGDPEYVDEVKRERAYQNEYRTVASLLANFDWDPQSITRFVTMCKTLGFERREDVAKKLLDLVNYCEPFRAVTSKPSEGQGR